MTTRSKQKPAPRASKRAKSKARRRGAPVSAEIARAAERAGIEPAEPEPDKLSPDQEVKILTDEIDRMDLQLVAARAVVKEAVAMFESGDELPSVPSSTQVLREGLRAAIADFELLAALAGDGSSPEYRDFWRAEHRCRLAIALAEYAEKHELPGVSS